MGAVRGRQKAKSGSSRIAWTFLVAAALCGTAGVVINDAAGNASKLSKHAVLIYGGSAIVLWVLAVALLAFGIARFSRARTASEQEREQATAQQLADEHLTHAGLLAGQLLAGNVPAVGKVWDVVLQPGERALLEGILTYSRYYGAGSPATYTHVSTRHYGNVGVGRVVLDHALDGAGNRRRKQEAAFAAATRWRERQESRVVVTDTRLLCQVQAKGWLSFDHRATTAIQPVAQTRSLVLEYPEIAPVCLSGPLTAELAVIVVWALYGPDGLREHPAISEVRALAPFPTATDLDRSDAQESQSDEKAVQSEAQQVDLLALLATRELVLAEPVARLLGISDQEAVERLEELIQSGLVSRLRFSVDSPVAYRITEGGAVRAGAASPPDPVDLAGDQAAAVVLVN